jgi:subtilisin family serine protease
MRWRGDRRFRGIPAVVLAAGLAFGAVAPAPGFETAARWSPGKAGAPIDASVLRTAQANGFAGFWILLRSHADLSGAASIRSWDARGEFVVRRLMSAAATGQRRVRALLDRRDVPYRAFWAIDAIRVHAADAPALQAVAAMPEVERITAPWLAWVDPIVAASASAMDRPQTPEWNISAIRAPKVWKKFHDRGEGVVVGNIDTGVQFDHPALVAQYRGNEGGGHFHHNYNWFDPAKACPKAEPCDNVAHGTHVMGTSVGDDGDPGANQIGVAPHAKWIAAKGCEDSACSDESLVASGQWMLAPTNLKGKKPKPNLRPDVIENAWGGGGADEWYRPIVQDWVAAGIFPVFTVGSSGPGCGTVGVPASYPESYGVGAFDQNDAIAGFSSRGPSPFGVIKPNIAAPGVNIRSSVPDDTYSVYSGTSMASAHVAGVVALIVAAAPELRHDVAAIRAVLDGSALDRDDTRCGGDPGNNNVWGEGRLDAFSAVKEARSLAAERQLLQRP